MLVLSHSSRIILWNRIYTFQHIFCQVGNLFYTNVSKILIGMTDLFSCVPWQFSLLDIPPPILANYMKEHTVTIRRANNRYERYWVAVHFLSRHHRRHTLFPSLITPSSLYLQKDWGCVILREIDFLLNICWSIPCLHPSWKVHTTIVCDICNHRQGNFVIEIKQISRSCPDPIFFKNIYPNRILFRKIACILRNIQSWSFLCSPLMWNRDE